MKAYGPAPTLRDADVPIVVPKNVDLPKIIFAGTHDKRTDQGDSGGPLFYKKDGNDLYQVGVTSYGCNRTGHDAPVPGKTLICFLIDCCLPFQTLLLMPSSHTTVIGSKKKPMEKSNVFPLK